ncbi:hypothetical protein HDU96_011145 [Phlyctochytrium bullatum]|nr:hypothetical protein HDU96_011145 [Phlyctochytrium bullatum]
MENIPSDEALTIGLSDDTAVTNLFHDEVSMDYDQGTSSDGSGLLPLDTIPEVSSPFVQVAPAPPPYPPPAAGSQGTQATSRAQATVPTNDRAGSLQLLHDEPRQEQRVERYPRGNERRERQSGGIGRSQRGRGRPTSRTDSEDLTLGDVIGDPEAESFLISGEDRRQYRVEIPPDLKRVLALGQKQLALNRENARRAAEVEQEVFRKHYEAIAFMGDSPARVTRAEQLAEKEISLKTEKRSKRNPRDPETDVDEVVRHGKDKSFSLAESLLLDATPEDRSRYFRHEDAIYCYKYDAAYAFRRPFYRVRNNRGRHSYSAVPTSMIQDVLRQYPALPPFEEDTRAAFNEVFVPLLLPHFRALSNPLRETYAYRRLSPYTSPDLRRTRATARDKAMLRKNCRFPYSLMTCPEHAPRAATSLAASSSTSATPTGPTPTGSAPSVVTQPAAPNPALPPGLADVLQQQHAQQLALSSFPVLSSTSPLAINNWLTEMEAVVQRFPSLGSTDHVYRTLFIPHLHVPKANKGYFRSLYTLHPTWNNFKKAVLAHFFHLDDQIELDTLVSQVKWESCPRQTVELLAVAASQLKRPRNEEALKQKLIELCPNPRVVKYVTDELRTYEALSPRVHRRDNSVTLDLLGRVMQKRWEELEGSDSDPRLEAVMKQLDNISASLQAQNGINARSSSADQGRDSERPRERSREPSPRDSSRSRRTVDFGKFGLSSKTEPTRLQKEVSIILDEYDDYLFNCGDDPLTPTEVFVAMQPVGLRNDPRERR